mmetsp:Transcript_108915/g.272941  ORF Transcript_108915/g.272941 Transcript_108915/m.272941 type:complete len:342 (-) Transcript_108915:483-1508(-)
MDILANWERGAAHGLGQYLVHPLTRGDVPEVLRPLGGVCEERVGEAFHRPVWLRDTGLEPVQAVALGDGAVESQDHTVLHELEVAAAGQAVCAQEAVEGVGAGVPRIGLVDDHVRGREGRCEVRRGVGHDIGLGVGGAAVEGADEEGVGLARGGVAGDGVGHVHPGHVREIGLGVEVGAAGVFDEGQFVGGLRDGERRLVPARAAIRSVADPRHHRCARRTRCRLVVCNLRGMEELIRLRFHVEEGTDVLDVLCCCQHAIFLRRGHVHAVRHAVDVAAITAAIHEDHIDARLLPCKQRRVALHEGATARGLLPAGGDRVLTDVVHAILDAEGVEKAEEHSR